MSWVPPNLSAACAVYNTLTTCQPSTFIFLELVVGLFGRSRDDTRPNDFNSFGYVPDYSKFFGEDDSSENHGTSNDRTEYDFIIIGAGSAGCVLANRLTEIAKWNVLLLEAGEEEPDAADVPGFAPMLQLSSIDWGYRVQPQPHSCLARTNGQCTWPRGKVMGGSSTINYMIYIRGGPADYDEWESLGNKGWSYREVLPYFVKSENNQDHKHIDRYYHGQGGYLNVERFRYQDENVFYLLDAYKELGLEEIDQNSERQVGTMLMQHTTKHGERHSANGAFIRPIRRKRENLRIETQAEVIRVLIDPTTKTAFGAEYVQNGKVFKVFAKKEVIVSGGTINSPKVLMLSGIGPAEHLHENGIDVLKDLKVGYNLHDHVTIDGVLVALSNHTATTVSDEQRESDIYHYKKTLSGPLSATGTVQVNAFVQTKYEEDHDRPDIQFTVDPANVENFVSDPILTAETNVLPLSYYDGLLIRPILLSPRSRGRVELNRTDPIYGHPTIYTNTFTESVDLYRIVEGIKQGLNLLRTHAMQKIGARLVSTPLHACTEYEFGTDDYWACVATSYTSTIYHPVGTCKMGPRHDAYAVVDPELRVHGIKNLRVIDASIMPIIVRGNTNAPVIMIAEKGSDLIKKKWLKHYYPQHNGVRVNHNHNRDFFKDFDFNFKRK